MPVIYINNDDIRLNSSSSDKVVVTGNLGIGTTAPGAKLTIGPSFATTNGFTIDTSDSSHSQIIARKTSSKTAFGVLAWDTSVFLSAGIYYEGGAWVQGNHNGTNQLFTFSPGSGVRWYASNNGSGSWNVSSDVQLWDDAAIWTSLVRSTRAGNSYFTGGNVGIGTTSPDSKLTVSGSGYVIKALATGSDSVYLQTVNGSYDYIAGIATSLGYGLMGMNSNHSLAIMTNATEQMRITSAGNVGIGTTSPTQILSISRVSTDNYIKVEAGSTVSNYSGLMLTEYGINWGWALRHNAATDLLHISYQDNTPTFSDVVTFDRNGNVGIGTTSPGAKLDVSGNIRTSTYYNFNGNPSNPGDAIASLYDQSGVGPTLSGLNVAFRAGSTPAEVMRITSAGNVGIGTTSPNSYAGYTALTLDNPASGGIIDLEKAGTRIGSLNVNDGNFNIVNPIASDMLLFTSFQERLRITAGGNVGIGTTSPAAKLHLTGEFETNYALQISGTYGTGRTFGWKTNGGNSDVLSLYDLTSTNRMAFFGNNEVGLQTQGSIRLYINSTGNVGIGTTSPARKLTVYDASDVVNGQLRLGYSDDYYWELGRDGSVQGRLMFVNKQGGAVSELMSILPSGDVGIGTTSPSSGSKLQVEGNIFSNNVGGNSFSMNSAGANYGFILNNSANTFSLGYGPSLGTVGSSVLTWNSSGNVGIGTTSPSEKLHVVGTGYFTSFVGIAATTTSSWGLAVGTPAGADGAIKTTGSVQINSGALAVGSITPSATAGRIDASNDIVAYSTSDSRLKENITPIANALDKVKSLTGVEFDWKEETKDVHGYEGHDVGVIAQEVQAVLPEAIRTNDSGYLSVRYEKMIALLIEANKELAARVEELERKLK